MTESLPISESGSTLVTDIVLPLLLLALVAIIRAAVDKHIIKKDVIKATFELPCDILLLALSFAFVAVIKLPDKSGVQLACITIIVVLALIILVAIGANRGIAHYDSPKSFRVPIILMYAGSFAAFAWSSTLLMKV